MSDKPEFPEQWVLVVGRPDSGFMHFGPFDNFDKAGIFGEAYFPDAEFWVIGMVTEAEWQQSCKELENIMPADHTDLGNFVKGEDTTH